MSREGIRVGVDIGGTFTDCLLAGPDQLSWAKVPTTPAAPEEAALEAFDDVLSQSGCPPDRVDGFVHGTTLGLNTLLERRGSTCGVLITRGFRDVLELGRLRLPSISDYQAQRPAPMVPRRRVIEIDERISVSGEVRTPLDIGSVRSAVEALVSSGVNAIAICFLHSHRNPEHEQLVAQLIRDQYPTIHVTASSEIWPERGEYERFLVAVINAYLGPAMQRYFQRLQGALGTRGFAGQLYITKSNGGVMAARRASEIPVATILSGPAAGVVGAWRSAQQAGVERAIAFDMGGTSADMSVLNGGITYSFNNDIADNPIVMPSVDVFSIGSGGGSIARLDPVGVLKVGPLSAGSIPGPACYGLGGKEPTLTDAYLVLGIISPESFLGGRMRLVPDDAHRALERNLKGNSDVMAGRVLEVATATMYSRFAPYLARMGVEPADYTLVAYGGAGPTHSFLLADELGIRKVIVPPRPGLLCAVGCLVADVRSDYVTSVSLELSASTIDAVRQAADGLRGQARKSLMQGTLAPGPEFLWSADFRYRGQTHTVTVPLPERSLRDANRLASGFTRRYSTIFGDGRRNEAVELINLRLQVVERTPGKAIVDDGGLIPDAYPSRGVRSRQVHLFGDSFDATIRWRWSLKAGEEILGPAVIEQEDTTVFAPPGWRLAVDGRRNLFGERL